MSTEGPPSDIGAESQVLGAALFQPSIIDEVTEYVEPSDFYRPAHELIWQAILDQHNGEEPVDPKLIGERLRIGGNLQRVGGLVYLANLYGGLITAANATHYARIVQRCSAQRALQQAGHRIQQMATADEIDDIAEVQAHAKHELDQAITARARDRVVWAHESVMDTLANLEEPPPVCPSPWSDLDRIIGGTAAGRLYVIGARPAVGKTVAGVQWAAEQALNTDRACLYFTLEMSAREIDIRLLSQAAKVDYGRLVTHQLSEQDWDQIAGVQGKLSELPLSVVDRPNLRIDDIRRIARKVAKERALGMIVVDYLQLMSHSDPKMPRHLQVGDFSRSLKLLSRELEVPVVAMSQLNRASEQRANRMPGLTDLRESGAVEQDSDVVILLHRPVEEPEKAHDLSMLVAKNRFGPPGGERFVFQGQYQRIEQRAWRPSDVLDNTEPSR